MICHGSSDRQVLAIADAVEERLRLERGRRPGHVEGRRSGDWVLMDYFDFVVHVFVEEKRKYYGLDRLWGDAPNLVLDEVLGSPTSATPRSPRASV